MVKNKQQVAAMREGGRYLAEILQKLLAMVKPGIAPKEIDRHATALIAKAGGEPSFPTVHGYHWATCICVNEAVVHGIPGEAPLRPADIVSIDVGMLYHGLHTDTAWTIPVDATQRAPTLRSFLQTGEQALERAIAASISGNKTGHISASIQTTIESAGYHVFPTLVGHGVGATLHEPPQVPGILRGDKQDTVPLQPGMTIAIEVIYAQGAAEETTRDDGWTVASADGSLTALFEKTILVGDSKPIVLTA